MQDYALAVLHPCGRRLADIHVVRLIDAVFETVSLGKIDYIFANRRFVMRRTRYSCNLCEMFPNERGFERT